MIGDTAIAIHLTFCRTLRTNLYPKIRARRTNAMPECVLGELMAYLSLELYQHGRRPTLTANPSIRHGSTTFAAASAPKLFTGE